MNFHRVRVKMSTIIANGHRNRTICQRQLQVSMQNRKQPTGFVQKGSDFNVFFYNFLRISPVDAALEYTVHPSICQRFFYHEEVTNQVREGQSCSTIERLLPLFLLIWLHFTTCFLFLAVLC